MKPPYDLESRFESIPPLLTRITLATAFLVSAKTKFADKKGTAEFFKQLGIPAPKIMATFVGGTEATCGTLLGTGLLTRAAALPLIPVMVVAILTARRKDFRSFSELTGIYEFTYILLLSYLVSQGAGKISVDYLLRVIRAAREKPSREEKLPRAA